MQDAGIENSTADAILCSVGKCEDLVSKTFEVFKNTKSTEKYLTGSSHYVKPERVSLGTGEFQYVPVIETLKKISCDQSFQKLRKAIRPHNPEDDENPDVRLSDLDDGQRLKNSTFFKSNPDALK
jgi:hypothetical protein